MIGDPRAVRVGGPPVANPAPSDAACGRSSDSLAAELVDLLAAPVMNLACPSATTATGLLGPQERGGLLLPPQVGVLKQVEGLRFVAVAIGPNDLGWSDLVTYCYAVENCTDNLSQGEFDYRLAAFDRDYGHAAGRAGRAARAAAGDRGDLVRRAARHRGPGVRGHARPGRRAGLSTAEIELLDARNDQLNTILAAGAEKYDFDVARPHLAPLCEPVAGEATPAPGSAASTATSAGRDLQGLADPFPFHPTGTGSLRAAAAVARLITPDPAGN